VLKSRIKYGKKLERLKVDPTLFEFGTSYSEMEGVMDELQLLVERE
jgi:hypothetical protein